MVMNPARTASLVLVASGLALAVFAWFSFQDRLAIIRKWKPVEARVIESSIGQREENGESGPHTIYRANYELAYSFDGKPLRSTAYTEDMPLATEKRVFIKIYRHPRGSTGIVHVNPDSPEQVRLNLGFNVYTFAEPLWAGWFAASLLMIGISLWFFGTPAVFW
jgi:hypothetical protein